MPLAEIKEIVGGVKEVEAGRTAVLILIPAALIIYFLATFTYSLGD